jgi:SsrA-binding protein
VKPTDQRDLVVNRKARHEYHLEDHFEAGVALLGSEVKSIRAGRANLQQAYVRVGDDGAWLVDAHVSPYEQANRNNHDPLRPKKLLLHATELLKLKKGLTLKGMTVVPVRLYLKGSYVKLELALAKGKKLHDKRESTKEREVQRDLARR